MSAASRDKIYIKHIITAISRINEYIKGATYESFIKNNLIQDGVIRQLEIIGEAVRHLSSEFTTANTLIPWKDIAGMRNKLIHDYMGVDIDAVWATVKNDIPDLLNKMKKIS
jgi:uncharacterized protein with HEPN domain